MRATARLSALVGALALGLLLHGAWRLVRAPSPIPRLFLRSAAWLFGARRVVTGAPLRRDVVFVANHLSWLDILLLAGTTGCAFVAKAELARVPLVGFLCRLNGTLFVSRADRMGIAAQIDQLRAALDAGWAVAIFPEGTTGDGVELLPFKPALLGALDPAPGDVRVQPVRIDYGAATRELAWVGDEPGQHHALRVLRRRGTFTARLAFLDPFVPEGGRKAIAAEARARIAASAALPLAAEARARIAASAALPLAAEARARIAASAALPLAADDLLARRRVWEALSDLFLDTDVAALRAGDAAILAASPYTLDQLERILVEEVTPACRFNLRSIAGEWAGFDPAWLEARILGREAVYAPARDAAMWPDWLALRDAVAARRAAAGGPPPSPAV